MNKEQIEGNWHKIKGKIMQTWGEITSNDLTRVKGNIEELSGILQKKYGYTKDKATKEIERLWQEYDLN